MTVAETSLAAYHAISPKALGRKQTQVLAFLVRRGPMSNHSLSKAMGWPVNRITGRVKELRDMGLVELAGYEVDPETKMEVCVWKAVEVKP